MPPGTVRQTRAGTVRQTRAWAAFEPAADLVQAAESAAGRLVRDLAPSLVTGRLAPGHRPVGAWLRIGRRLVTGRLAPDCRSVGAWSRTCREPGCGASRGRPRTRQDRAGKVGLRSIGDTA